MTLTNLISTVCGRLERIGSRQNTNSFPDLFPLPSIEKSIVPPRRDVAAAEAAALPIIEMNIPFLRFGRGRMPGVVTKSGRGMYVGLWCRAVSRARRQRRGLVRRLRVCRCRRARSEAKCGPEAVWRGGRLNGFGGRTDGRLRAPGRRQRRTPRARDRRPPGPAPRRAHRCR